MQCSLTFTVVGFLLSCLPTENLMVSSHFPCKFTWLRLIDKESIMCSWWDKCRMVNANLIGRQHVTWYRLLICGMCLKSQERQIIPSDVWRLTGAIEVLWESVACIAWNIGTFIYLYMYFDFCYWPKFNSFTVNSQLLILWNRIVLWSIMYDVYI